MYVAFSYGLWVVYEVVQIANQNGRHERVC